MNEAIKCQQSGIKCDNTNCDYKIDVNYSEYINYVNKPCPLCGENLLTEKDYKSAKLVHGVVNLFNKVLPKRKSTHDESKDANMKIEFNNDGKLECVVTKENSKQN